MKRQHSNLTSKHRILRFSVQGFRCLPTFLGSCKLDYGEYRKSIAEVASTSDFSFGIPL